MKITNKTPSPAYLSSRVGNVPIGCLFVFGDEKVYLRITDSIETDSARAVCMESGEIMYFDSDAIVTHAQGELTYHLTSKGDF